MDLEGITNDSYLSEAAQRELKEETGLDMWVCDVTAPYFSSVGMTDETCAIVHGVYFGVPSLKGQERRGH